MNQVCYNGRFLAAGQPVHSADDRSFRYGDGLFETMMLDDGRIRLGNLHRQRLERSMDLLEISYAPHSGWDQLAGMVKELGRKNSRSAGYSGPMRVRLSLSRGTGGINEEPGEPNWLIETWPLDLPPGGWNVNGLVVGLYPHARKSMDPFSSLKTANFLPYVMAARFARSRKWNDSILLNAAGRIADSTIANVFLATEEGLITPPVAEGCVAGVMREFLVRILPGDGVPVKEAAVQVDDLAGAEELLLTNVVRGVRWVREFSSGETPGGTKNFSPSLAQRISAIVEGSIRDFDF